MWRQSRGMSQSGPVLDFTGVFTTVAPLVVVVSCSGSRFEGSSKAMSSRWISPMRSMTGVVGRAQIVMQFLGSNSGG